MVKHELRKKYTNLRAKLEPATILEDSVLLANQALRLPIWDFVYFHIFLSALAHKEVDTLPLLTLLQGRDKQVVVPKVIQGTKGMAHYLLTDSTALQMSSWGIPEPVEGIAVAESKMDVVFVPLLAFDAAGQRVGYGKGYYDTFLRTCRKETITVGLSLFEVEPEFITDVYEDDVKLQYCITPQNVYTF